VANQFKVKVDINHSAPQLHIHLLTRIPVGYGIKCVIDLDVAIVGNFSLMPGDLCLSSNLRSSPRGSFLRVGGSGVGRDCPVPNCVSRLASTNKAKTVSIFSRKTVPARPIAC
jgi:hypothetical protein